MSPYSAGQTCLVILVPVYSVGWNVQFGHFYTTVLELLGNFLGVSTVTVNTWNCYVSNTISFGDFFLNVSYFKMFKLIET